MAAEMTDDLLCSQLVPVAFSTSCFSSLYHDYWVPHLKMKQRTYSPMTQRKDTLYKSVTGQTESCWVLSRFLVATSFRPNIIPGSYLVLLYGCLFAIQYLTPKKPSYILKYSDLHKVQFYFNILIKNKTNQPTNKKKSQQKKPSLLVKGLIQLPLTSRDDLPLTQSSAGLDPWIIKI